MLNRALQLRILEAYAALYPNASKIKFDDDVTSLEQVRTNLFYLYEHGLIDAQWIKSSSGERHPGPIRISAKGMDFLMDDGGLSAVLGILTVKLHDESIRKLLIDKVEQSAGDATTKASLIKAIKEVPADGLKHLAQKAMDAGIERSPDAIRTITAWLGL